MTGTATGNLLGDIPDASREERFEDLATAPGFRIERIVSGGQASPEGFWYDQEEAEWVVLLRGQAVVEIEDPPQTLELSPGDWILLPARCRHRVASTDPAQSTVWLAVHSRRR